ncbi:hypothetical protein SNEBB_001429 [Seison nebaliae]|nr:hypothetical protein SNEBB_001429 [Seison nebaliae]
MKELVNMKNGGQLFEKTSTLTPEEKSDYKLNGLDISIGDKKNWNFIDADKFYVNQIDQPVKLRIPDELDEELLQFVGSRTHSVFDPPEVLERGNLWNRKDELLLQNCEPLTLMEQLKRTVDRVPERMALAVETEGNEWKKWTYQQYWDESILVARALLSFGMKRFDCLSILGFNSPYWHLSYVGCAMAGSISAGIYTTNNSDAIAHILRDSRCRICVVDSLAQLDKVLVVRNDLPNLERIIYYGKDESSLMNEKYQLENLKIMTWNELIVCGGENSSNDEVEERIRNIAANQCLTLIYTSGTTGDPKGAMISHDNAVWTAKALGLMFDLHMNEMNILVSYLPLSHIAAQLLDLYAPIVWGFQMWFARPDALKGSLVTTLKRVRPTIVLGVPRVWEKIQEKMKSVGSKSNFVKRMIGNMAKSIGLSNSRRCEENICNDKESSIIGFSLANRFIFERVRHELGLDRARITVTGAAPITRDTLEYFHSLNINLTEIYGMSESTGPSTTNIPQAFNLGTVGLPLLGTRVAIGSTEIDDLKNCAAPSIGGTSIHEEDIGGEVCIWGRHIFMGYLNSIEKTEEATTPDGFLKSGDLGRFNDHQFLQITGRIKELLITAGGENVAPVPIEERLLIRLPHLISNCMLIGDKRRFISVLITLKSKIDTDNQEPLDDLSGEAISYLKNENLTNFTSIQSVINASGIDAKRFDTIIMNALKEVNKLATSRACHIQKYAILPRDFSLLNGELGPTLKVKRRVVTRLYSHIINRLYDTTMVDSATKL